MSRSNKEINITNPSTRWFEWAGSQGKLKWYDSANKETHYVDLPFRFLVLDQLNTVTGYSDELKTGFFASEVRRPSDVITLRTKKGIEAKDVWKDGLSHIKGARFTKSVYIAYFEDGELKLGNIKFSGATLGGLSDTTIDANLKAFKKGEEGVELFSDKLLESVGWFNFCLKHPDIEDIAVEIVDKIADKKGSNDFFRPVFKAIPVSDETNEKAIELDCVLQEYLTAYFEKNEQEPEKAQAATASADNDDYINQRNKEIEQYDDNLMPEEGELSEDDIPF